MSGLLGGIVSSTAVSIAAGRIAQKSPELSASALQSSILASSVMYVRILVLIWLLNPSLAAVLWWKLVLLSAVGVTLSIQVRGVQAASGEQEVAALQNPFEIRPAVLFAILFVVLSVATSFIKTTIGDTGILVLSSVVGVTDVTPFILSLVHGLEMNTTVTIPAVILAMMSNTIAKGGYFGTLAPRVRRETIWRYAVWAILHLPLVFFI
jgi:uncharacterized membrane protein (DUF4010 family)